jgi:hypothetical protein
MSHLLTGDDKFPDLTYDDAYRSYLITRTDTPGDYRFVRSQLGRVRLRKQIRAVASRAQACNEHRHNAGQKNSVESSGSKRSAHPTLQLIEIEQISPDESVEAAADVKSAAPYMRATAAGHPPALRHQRRSHGAGRRFSKMSFDSTQNLESIEWRAALLAAWLAVPAAVAKR